MTERKCPFCGAPPNWRDLLKDKQSDKPAWRPWKRREFTAFGARAEQAISMGAEYERRRPIRDPHVETDVAVPALQSVLTGVSVGIASGAISAALHWPKPLLVALGLSGGAMALSWLVLLRAHRDLLWEIERITGADLDRDGAVGEPVRVDTEPEPRVTRVEVTERGRGNTTRVRFVDVPLSDRELERVAHSVLTAKQPFSRRGLSDILTQSQYADVYNAMLEGGLLRKDGRGVQLSPSGRAFLGQYVE